LHEIISSVIKSLPMRVLFFAQIRQAVGTASVELATGEVDVPQFWQILSAMYPPLAQYQSHVRLARNGEFVGNDARFTNTDEVALIPPVSGG
jgi:molybdopterin converting factor subunit 1